MQLIPKEHVLIDITSSILTIIDDGIYEPEYLRIVGGNFAPANRFMTHVPRVFTFAMIDQKVIAQTKIIEKVQAYQRSVVECGNLDCSITVEQTGNFAFFDLTKITYNGMSL